MNNFKLKFQFATCSLTLWTEVSYNRGNFLLVLQQMQHKHSPLTGSWKLQFPSRSCETQRSPALSSTLWAVGCQFRMPTRLQWPSSFTTGSVSGEVSPPSGISQIWSQNPTCKSHDTTEGVLEESGVSVAPPWRCSPQIHWQWCCHCEGRTRCPEPDLCGHRRWGRTCRYVQSADTNIENV